MRGVEAGAKERAQQVDIDVFAGNRSVISNFLEKSSRKTSIVVSNQLPTTKLLELHLRHRPSRISSNYSSYDSSHLSIRVMVSIRVRFVEKGRCMYRRVGFRCNEHNVDACLQSVY